MSIKNEFMDRRIIRSKKAMKAALLSLMTEKEFRDITVTDIVRMADINRGTFYKHYQTTEDILEEITDEVILDLIDSFREPYKNMEVFELTKLTSTAIKIFDHVKRFAEFYSLMVRTNTLAGFQHRFCGIVKDVVLNDFKNEISHPNINVELNASYQAYAILGIIIEWINGGFKYSSTYMAEQLLEFIRNKQSNPVYKPRI
ncbi:TetR/AcrR family transcriptional regulator [Bacillus sp. MRMR6]|uniref:TetR/AcrR family transcriptional regulator n=1 Tax=Bacillus sp. MRMR6 TaxID=1928617 RepID=UPI00095314D9|nr:TetR-like C-terminal domain-containing protein [Bacillus sp. MRMR6]OLS40752.1 TetR family transcriptional regulator [Bacillus sp. MRMR6]